mmetsp:Transcript_51249/g.158796  ORF Transcript_51249/g.158796 Transcript_51249/m.158796 type:complete len:82 (-) Transcript_51249:167-412(-)
MRGPRMLELTEKIECVDRATPRASSSEPSGERSAAFAFEAKRGIEGSGFRTRCSWHACSGKVRWLLSAAAWNFIAGAFGAV